MRSIVSLFLILVSAPVIFGQASEVASVTISATEPDGRSARTVIVSDGKSFSRDKQPLASELVAEFLKQIDVKATPTAASIGITAEFLELRAISHLPDTLKYFGTPEEQALWRRSFTDLAVVEKVIRKIFEDGDRTSTMPARFVSVELRKSDGTTVSFESRERNLFMFSNPRLGKAIAALLPAGFPNRHHLNGSELPKMVAAEIEAGLSDRLGAAWREKKIRKIVDASEIKLKIVDSSFESGENGKTIWNARLRTTDMPEGVAVRVRLAFVRGELINFREVASRFKLMLDQARRADWLWKLIKANPEFQSSIVYDLDRSISVSLRRQILVAAKEFRRKLSVSALSGAVLIEVRETPRSNTSRWVVFSDGTTMLWDMTFDTVFRWSRSAMAHSIVEPGFGATVIFRFFDQIGLPEAFD